MIKNIQRLGFLAIMSLPFSANAQESYMGKLDAISNGCKIEAEKQLKLFEAAEKNLGVGSGGWYSSHAAMTASVKDCIDKAILSSSYVYRDEVDRHPIAKAQIKDAYSAWRAYLQSLNSDKTGFYEKSYLIEAGRLKAKPYAK